MQKNLISFLLFISSFVSASTITGTIKDSTGQPFNGSIVFLLNAPAMNNVTHEVITPVAIPVTITNGAPPAGTNLVGNDVLSPSNSAYYAAYYDAYGKFLAVYYYSISGTTFDLGSAIPTPITTTNISYQDLLGLRQITVKNLEGIRFADQFIAASTTLKVTAACNDIGGNGIVIVSSNMAAGSIPTMPSGCVVLDFRGNTGNGGILLSRQLSGTEQYGFQFATQNLASDGQSSTAILGAVPSGISGTNVVGVRGQVFSPGSAAIYGVNFGVLGFGGPGIQGDIPGNIVNGIGVLGTTNTTGTIANPNVAVKGSSTGNIITDGSVGVLGVNDNGLAISASGTGAAAFAGDNHIIQFKSGYNSGAGLCGVSSTAVKEWCLRLSGSADPLGLASGSISLYDKTDGRVPFTINSAAPTNSFAINAAGNTVVAGLSLAGATTLTSQTGTSAVIVTNVNSAQASPTFNTGITNSGTGFKHIRSATTCTTGAAVGSICTTAAITLPGTAFADTSYTLVCNLSGTLTNVPVLINTAKSVGSFTVTIAALTAAAASYAEVDCQAVHD